MNKDYKVTFYMKNGKYFKIYFFGTSKEDLMQNIGRLSTGNIANFFGNDTMEDFINLNEVNYFHIEEINDEEDNIYGE